MRVLMLLLFILGMVGCSTFPHRDPLNIEVAGIEPLPGEGLEMRMAVKIRIQNPNDNEVKFTGAALTLYLNEGKLGNGVSNESGTIPRYSETVVTIPVSISAFSAAQQLFGIMGGTATSELSYRVSGKLQGESFGAVKFSDEGRFQMSPLPAQ
jgi:LEA14-like dessication related protein